MSKTDTVDRDIRRYGKGIQKEWILTNGLGGYASSTIIEANTRKYHGLLVAALNPPVDRTVLLSSLDMEVEIDGKVHRLSVHKYPNTVNPKGFEYLESFKLEPCPTWTYRIEDIEIKKSIFMAHGQNTTIINYDIKNPEKDNIIFRLYPLVNMRGFHQTIRSNDLDLTQESGQNRTSLKAKDYSFNLISDIRYHPNGVWHYNIEYDIERLRGQSYQEDAYNPGYFEKEVEKGIEKISFVATTQHDFELSNIKRLYEEHIQRIEILEDSSAFTDPFASKLVRAADSFIVKRKKSTGKKSIIAGYHWFSDWGRDTMISIPGLTLVTGRFDEAAEILSTFAQYCRGGLIPNRFPDSSNREPEYNTVDASLWFIHAVGRYFEYTGDTEFVRKIWGTVEEIIHSYEKGTHFSIRMESDGLISQGSQLTWMDAKVGDIEITPRSGKACEINALWYNGLRTAAYLAEHIGKDTDRYNLLADDVRKSFQNTFWNRDENCLFDCIDPENVSDSSIRPNQIFAVSLPYTMLSHNKEMDIVRKVEAELLTPMGLRTLSQNDPLYKGKYEGDAWMRDSAYHNGTVWPWLMGPYVSAYMKVNGYSKESREKASSLLKGFEPHLMDAGLGTISEIADGNPPHRPGGCISQAWSVAEILRAYVEDVLGKKP